MQQTVWKGKIFRVFQEEVSIGEKTKIFEYSERSPGVRVLLIKDEKILLIKERRYELQAYDYRLPGGKVFDSIDEYLDFLDAGNDIALACLQAAIKETKEETGITLQRCNILHKDIIGSTVRWDLYYIQGEEFEMTKEQELGEGEYISCEWVSFDTLHSLMKSGQMSESRTRAFLYDRFF